MSVGTFINLIIFCLASFINLSFADETDHPYFPLKTAEKESLDETPTLSYATCRIEDSTGFRPQWYSFSAGIGTEIPIRNGSHEGLVLKCWGSGETHLTLPIQISSLSRVGASFLASLNGSTGLIFRFGNLKGRTLSDLLGTYEGMHFGLNAIYGFNGYYFRKKGISLQIYPYLIDIGLGFSFAHAEIDIKLDTDQFSLLPIEEQTRLNQLMHYKFKNNPKFEKHGLSFQ